MDFGDREIKNAEVDERQIELRVEWPNGNNNDKAIGADREFVFMTLGWILGGFSAGAEIAFSVIGTLERIANNGLGHSLSRSYLSSDRKMRWSRPASVDELGGLSSW